MKFKKVEIQDFKAYNDVNDGTFDFMTKSNEIADFICIYAPNGFGKTSFYEAVEWGYTNHINRLNKNSAKADNSSNSLNSRDSLDEEKEGFVKLYTTSSETPIYNKIPKRRSDQPDLMVDEKGTMKERKYFQKVILAQEWIDTFLKEEDAGIRYDKFIRAFGDVHLANNYKLITELINLNDRKIEELDKELTHLQRKLKLKFDPDILSKINSEICLLNASGEKIPLMRPDCKEKDLHQLADMIGERMIDLKYDVRTYQKKIAKIESANRKINALDYFFKKELEMDLSNKEMVELEKILNENLASMNEKIRIAECLLQSFKKTKAFKDNILPLIKQKELKRSKDQILQNKAFLQNNVCPQLEQEKKLLSEHIDKQVESFFHNQLINLLYRKIDPHPKHKEISFKCDFSSDQPRLNVFIAADNSEEIVPSSYFSAAQLNILSLSIFLAKALHVKDDNGNPVDCIFLDDPLQSLDSINILSVIDLLRSIVVNMGKQIILSTHDENFWNLLQKKIPPDQFKAKYIELETLGKVKQ